MPDMRGRFVPKLEKVRAVKRTFDILLWIEVLSQYDLSYLLLLDELRMYLQAEFQGVCGIRLLVPDIFSNTAKALERNTIPFQTVSVPEVLLSEQEGLTDQAISRAVSYAAALSVDCLVVPKDSNFLSFAEDISKYIHCSVTETCFLLRICETYVRGFDIPWTFSKMILNATWNTFYFYAEQDFFDPLLHLLNTAQQAGSDRDTLEAIRSFAMNRMPQICYTRDKLQWLDLQREAAKRDGFKRQNYAFEISYHLNIYYLLLSGAFDHLALSVNGIYSLGLPERQVGATYKPFLEALQSKSDALYKLFTAVDTVDFIARLAALRNLAAHRGSITPRKIVEKPDHEPTAEEIDQHLQDTDNGWILTEPYISMSPQLVAMARANASAEIVEKNTIAEGMELIQYNGKQGFISPLLDTPWNFARVKKFILAVARECSTYLASSVPQASSS